MCLLYIQKHTYVQLAVYLLVANVRLIPLVDPKKKWWWRSTVISMTWCHVLQDPSRTWNIDEIWLHTANIYMYIMYIHIYIYIYIYMDGWWMCSTLCFNAWKHILLAVNEYLSTNSFGFWQKYQGGFDPQPYINKSTKTYLDKLQYFADLN